MDHEKQKSSEVNGPIEKAIVEIELSKKFIKSWWLLFNLVPPLSLAFFHDIFNID